jgi:CO/xanthine dehydrogenase FAD-binding subunit/aerobic-type carbon monoxide dehydrogenase small subunit (CoxS/CutS family)
VKPPPFGYTRPETTAEALAVLAELGEDGKILAGGQSLVPLMSMRLAFPSHLVDINRLTDLAYVRVTGPGPDGPRPDGPRPDGPRPDGPGLGGAGLPAGAGWPAGVRVGALARHARVLADPAAAAVQPLLAKALRFVAHPAIRNRGTTVGSIVHADPAGEMTAVLAVLGGTVRLASDGGQRVVPASEFFLGPLESAVEPGELATEALFPALPPGGGTAFAEVSRRHGDYALCGVAAVVQLGAEGRIDSARAAYLAVGPQPIVIDLTEAVAGLPAGTTGFTAAAALARAGVAPQPDIHATADYRRHLAGVLTERALAEAAAEARRRTAAGSGFDAERWAAAEPASPPPAGPAAEPGRRAGEAEPSAVRLTVNGTQHDVRVPPRRLLSDCLRHDLGLTGTHVGCEHGVCGACTVLVDGQPARSCLMLAVSADGAEITTVEGLAGPGGALSPVQQAFSDCHGLQCGFCTPGFLMTVTAGLRDCPDPTQAQAREMATGNLCRCTGYVNIVRSVLRAAELGRPDRARLAEAGTGRP